MDLSTSQLMLGLLFGTIGMAMFVYGKKQQHWIALGAGLGLMVFPYVVTNAWVMTGIGVALTALPFLVSLG